MDNADYDQLHVGNMRFCVGYCMPEPSEGIQFFGFWVDGVDKL